MSVIWVPVSGDENVIGPKSIKTLSLAHTAVKIGARRRKDQRKSSRT